MTPIIILGSIYSGYATPVEASVVAILYALFVGIVINRSLRLTHIYKALLEGAMICGTVLLIVGASTLFGKILTFEEAPQKLTSLVLGISKNPYVVLLMIIAVLYILGMFMETLSTIIILVPVLLPMILQLGIDPIHFGIIFILNLSIGGLTPPFGATMYQCCNLCGIEIPEFLKQSKELILALLVALLFVTFIPGISTLLPTLMK